MKQEWKTDEIIEHFTLLESEQELVSSAKAPHNKLVFIHQKDESAH